MGDYKIGEIYQGGYSTLDPTKSENFLDYSMSKAKDIGLSTDARTANILQEVSSKLSTGAKTIELNQVFPEVFEAVPKEQLKEINRISKLTGADMTFHAPIVGLDASGMDKQGTFSEIQREMVEREMISVIKRAQDIKPEGGLPITFHATEGIPGAYPQKSPEESREIFVINTEDNKLLRLPLRKREFTGREVNTQEELEKINQDSWTKNLQDLAYYSSFGDQLIKDSRDLVRLKEAEKKAGKPTHKLMEDSMISYNRGITHLQDSYRRLEEFYEIAYRNSEDMEKRRLKEFADNIKPKMELIRKNGFDEKSVDMLKEIIDTGSNLLSREITPPKVYKLADDFVLEKAKKTFGNVAFEAYKNFKDKAPIIAIENSYAGGAFSTGEDLKKIIEGSKEEFIKNAINSGLSESEARQQANKIIGATWDVGRLNTLRKYGFSEEELIKETEKIAPLVKKVHLSDNFGMESTETVMGAGNVPIKEIMEELKKKGFKGKNIIEAMHWWQHFKSSPLQQTFEAFGSPIYKEGVAPYWYQSQGFQQGYFGGYGIMLPQINYETFGGGFSQLPTELGGQRAGAQGGRMSGKPME
jgi:sugar phosphate isomerase/epimerase